MAEDHVADDEVLYRCVKPNLVKNENGTIRLSSQGFADRHYRPSVDRANLTDGPQHTQREASDLVVSLVALQVRDIHSVVQINEHGVEVRHHAIDVEPQPLVINLAHAEIYGTPDFANKRVFQRLQERLALLAQWQIKPPEVQ